MSLAQLSVVSNISSASKADGTTMCHTDVGHRCRLVVFVGLTSRDREDLMTLPHLCIHDQLET